ncbi:MAG: hypothetical protein Q8O56_15185 [Solirubrobacteraceae bacterium]|nr:hypothetical protein [Solirubrobacteraceae bacterium]
MTTRDAPLAYARDLLDSARDPAAAAIKTRWSKSLRERYLTNGCPHCDAPFGELSMNEAITDVLAADAIESLPILLSCRRPVIEWWALTNDRDNLMWWDEGQGTQATVAHRSANSARGARLGLPLSRA